MGAAGEDVRRRAPRPEDWPGLLQMGREQEGLKSFFLHPAFLSTPRLFARANTDGDGLVYRDTEGPRSPPTPARACGYPFEERRWLCGRIGRVPHAVCPG